MEFYILCRALLFMFTKYVATIHQDWKEEYFLVYAHEVISTALDLVICWRKPFKVSLTSWNVS